MPSLPWRCDDPVLEVANLLELLIGQEAGPDLIDAGGASHRIGGERCVSGEHRDAAAEAAQRGDVAAAIF